MSGGSVAYPEMVSECPSILNPIPADVMITGGGNGENRHEFSTAHIPRFNVGEPRPATGSVLVGICVHIGNMSES